MNRIPRLKIAHLPTPIEPLPRLSAQLGGPGLWIKRDDQTGLAFGGNKTRKLEFLVAQAQADGAHTLITAGAIQSNHCRQTAAAAARYGLRCVLVLYGNKPQGVTGNLLLDQLLGAEIVWTERAKRDEILQHTFDQAWENGNRPYLIPYGGSSPTGAAGYLFAVEELLEQFKTSSMPVPDWIVFASSSGGTQAGLAAGAHLFSLPAKVLGISVDEPEDVLKARVADLASKTLELVGEKEFLKPEDILVNSDYISAGYGVMTPAEKDVVQLFARLEGVLLDPVYTSRAAAGMVDLIQKGFFSKESNLLFWHTGGGPALFAEQYCSIID